MLNGIDEYARTSLAGASMSVAVVRGGKPLYAKAFGDAAPGRPATVDTAYLVASVTKPVTATAVCRAAEAGLLDLDAPVESYLGGISLPRNGFGAPSVRDVLMHRAGLGTYYDFYYDGERVPPLAETVARFGGLYREPGSGFEYSNLGYGLLDEVLRQVTGVPAAEYVRAQVFEPSGMTSAHIGPSYVGGGAHAVRLASDGREYPAYDTSHPGGSLLWATAGDLARFAYAQVCGDDALLSPAMRAAALDPLPWNRFRGYGMGWIVTNGEPVSIGHSGGMGGVTSMLVAVPSADLAVCVLTNMSDSPAMSAVFRMVLEELVPGYVPVTGEPEPTLLPDGTWRGVVTDGDAELPVRVTLRGGRAEVEAAGATAEADAERSLTWDLTVGVPIALPIPGAGPLLMLGLSADGDDALAGEALTRPDGDDGRWLGNGWNFRCRLERA